MKKTIAFLTAALLALQTAAFVAPVSAAEAGGLVINQDAAELIAAAGSVKSADQIKAFANQFAGSQVTDYVLAINNNTANFPSNAWTDIVEKGNAGAVNLYNTLKVDPIEVLNGAFTEMGVDFWLSVRVNSADGATDAGAGNILSDYFHNNPGVRRVTHGSPFKTAYHNAYDFAHASVRQNLLLLINEALDRYDTYGLELDFQRDIWLWQVGKEYHGLDIMNQLMRDIKGVVGIYEEKYGHPIKIGTRVARNVETNLDFGLDVMAWVAEGIVDRVAPSGRPGVNDNGMPIRLWDSLLSPYNVELTPVVDSGFLSGSSTTIFPQTLATYAGGASNVFSQGGDKVYLSGMTRKSFTDLITDEDKAAATATTANIDSDSAYWDLITLAGAADTALSINRSYILSHSDNYQIWDKGDHQLPLGIRRNQGGVIRIMANEFAADETVYLRISVGSANLTSTTAPFIYVNSKACQFVSCDASDTPLTSNYIVTYKVPADALSAGHIVADIASRNVAISIDYAEVYTVHAN